MARHLLTAKQVLAASDCDLADGDGLVLRVNGPNITAVLRYTSRTAGKRREMGLGGLSRNSLQAADAPIDRVTAIDLLDALVPILRKLPETGSRIYQRLGTIFDAAVIDGLPRRPAGFCARASIRSRSAIASAT